MPRSWTMNASKPPQSFIPECVLPPDTLNALIASGHGAAPDLIYARGIPDNPRPAPGSFDPKSCTLLLVEIGFCRDLGCREKLAEKTRKYQPLLRALEQIWGAVSLVCIPIGHAGTTLECTVENLSNALSRIRPPLAAARRDKGAPGAGLRHEGQTSCPSTSSPVDGRPLPPLPVKTPQYHR